MIKPTVEYPICYIRLQYYASICRDRIEESGSIFWKNIYNIDVKNIQKHEFYTSEIVIPITTSSVFEITAFEFKINGFTCTFSVAWDRIIDLENEIIKEIDIPKSIIDIIDRVKKRIENIRNKEVINVFEKRNKWHYNYIETTCNENNGHNNNNIVS